MHSRVRESGTGRKGTRGASLPWRKGLRILVVLASSDCASIGGMAGGSHPDLRRVEQVTAAYNVPAVLIRFEDRARESAGLWQPSTRTIRLHRGLLAPRADSYRTPVLAHELAHAVLDHWATTDESVNARHEVEANLEGITIMIHHWGQREVDAVAMMLDIPLSVKRAGVALRGHGDPCTEVHAIAAAFPEAWRHIERNSAAKLAVCEPNPTRETRMSPARRLSTIPGAIASSSGEVLRSGFSRRHDLGDPLVLGLLPLAAGSLLGVVSGGITRALRRGRAGRRAAGAPGR
jgi:hypothetical protein